MGELTHFTPDGASRMVDVSAKGATLRSATASALIRMRPETLALILDRRVAKGDVFEVARLAGIMAAKRTGDLIPLCHPLGIDGVDVGFEAVDDTSVKVEATVTVLGRTGVEMEALTAVSIAALTDLRHVQGGRPRHGRCPCPARSQVGRPERRLPSRGRPARVALKARASTAGSEGGEGWRRSWHR